MVPPEMTATMRDARDAVSVSLTRSQLMRVELRRDVRRILARQHRQDLVERAPRQIVIGVRLAHHVEERGTRPIVIYGHDGDDDLRQHVERILHDARRLDVSVLHRTDDGEHLEGVVAECGHEDAATHGLE
jgi:hypothetical protein